MKYRRRVVEYWHGHFLRQSVKTLTWANVFNGVEDGRAGGWDAGSPTHPQYLH